MNLKAKKLVLNKENKMICGVCGGIGAYLEIDPTVIRILWVLFSFFSVGMGILLYFIIAVIMPEADRRKTAAGPDGTGGNSGFGEPDGAGERMAAEVVEME